MDNKKSKADSNSDSRHTMSYEELLDRDGFFIFRSSGTSMLPLIKSGRDLIKIRAREKDENDQIFPLKKYDVALFTRDEKYVLHRVLDVIIKNNSIEYIICGDNQTFPEIVKDEQIIGILDCVIRDGAEIDPCDPEYMSGLETDLKKRRRKEFIQNLPYRIKRKMKRVFRIK